MERIKCPELARCPYCGREAELTIGKEMSDTTMAHQVRCSYLHCLTIEDSISGWQPDYSKCVQRMKDDWNAAVIAILKTKEDVKKIEITDWLTRGINLYQLEKEKTKTSKEFYKKAKNTNKNSLEYGIVKEFKNKNTLWYEPITDEINGFVLRGLNGEIINVWTEEELYF